MIETRFLGAATVIFLCIASQGHQHDFLTPWLLQAERSRRQADPQPAPRPFKRGINLGEHLENAGQLISGDADAGVAYANSDKWSDEWRSDAAKI